MICHNIILAIRSHLRYKIPLFINLIGLCTGLASALLIYLWVNDELSFDRFHNNSDRIFQVMERRQQADEIKISDESSGMLAETLGDEMPEVEYHAAIAPSSWFQKFTLSIGDKNVKASGQYVGPQYFNIFSFPLLQGNKTDVLRDKNSIVISRGLAVRLFGTTDNVVGKAIEYQHERQFQVSGIFEDLPANSSEQFDFLLSFEYYKDIQSWVKSWATNQTGPHNFVLLREGSDPKLFNKKIAAIISQHTEEKNRTAFVLPYANNYLYNSFDHGVRTGSRIENVRLFSLIAVFILLIACINFVNLSTARAARRTKEIGIKKATGASRPQLITQFLCESLLLTCISVLISVAIVYAILPEFNILTGKQIVLKPISLFLPLIAITLITALLAGSYPALYLSGFDPVTVLKGKLNTSFGELWIRKGLVVFQFTLTVVLVVVVIIVYEQIQYIQHEELGYNKDQIIRFDSEGKVLNTQETFLSALQQIPGVMHAAGSYHNIVGRNFGTNDISWPGKSEDEKIYFEGMVGSAGLLETLGMELTQGRGFNKDSPLMDEIIVNEEAVKTMGMKDPLGQMIEVNGRQRQIIGVLQNFHFESLHIAVAPMFHNLAAEGDNSWYKILIKLQAGHERETIERIESFYKTYNPGFTLDYAFLDEAFQKQYNSENHISLLSKYFAAIALVISCLGLIGLTAFTTERRTKEIGIRKVLGASQASIIHLISAGFLQITLVSIIIALPVSYLAGREWLNTFVYHVNLQWWYFLVPAMVVLAIAWLTVSLQAWRPSGINPVNSLKAE
ncbi:MAG TPA: ABC transporter permease [Chryseolinea sp.]|nr:ABC transporter permease [Chryseolinea sp.]